MRKKLWYGAIAAGLALLTTGCFSLQGFSILDSSLAPGAVTKAQFVLRPIDAVPSGSDLTPNNAFQFVMVGVDSSDLAVGKATWGTNGKFGGPIPMVVNSQLAGVLTGGGKCTSSGLGLDLSSSSGITWKAFMTPTKVNDKNLVDKTVVVQVGLKAKATAASQTPHEVIGVTGGWVDNASGGTTGVVDSTDQLSCTGISSDSLYVK